jgi:hypothetical protein
VKPSDVSELAVAGRQIGQARDALRKASRRIAAAQDGVDVYAARTCTTPRDADEAAAVLRLALAEHGRVDVVVLVPPAPS